MESTLQDVTLRVATSLLEVLPQLLRTYWILASSAVLLTLLPLPIPRAFKAAVRLAAARGKLWHNRPNATALGILKDVSVPQQFFEHFYIIGALVNTVLLQVYIFVCCPDEPGSTLKRDSLFALILFELHAMRRYYETNYVMHYPESARMHVLAYLFGMSYYIAVPLTLLPEYVMDMAVVRGAWDLAMGAGKSHWQSVDQRLWEAVTAPHPELARLAAGVALFLFASVLQFRSHSVLGRMAKEGDKRAREAQAAAALFPKRAAAADATNPDGSVPAPAVTDIYAIPQGGMFELVSCPHYLAEILIYAALAVVTRGSVTSLLLLGWVLLNLILAADATQRWYLSHFPDYPKRRAALVPGLF